MTDIKMSPQLKYYYRNREKILAKKREQHVRDPEKNRKNYLSRGQDYHLKNRYGITVQQRNELFVVQGSVCAVCSSKEPSGQGWCVDHDHETGKVRGVVCHYCNSMLGYAKDDPEILAAAAAYLERNKSG